MNMKLLPRIFSLTLLGCAAVLLSNCDKDEGSDPKERTLLNDLKGRWLLSSATLDNNPAPYFSDVVLVLAGNFISVTTAYNYYFEAGGEVQDPAPFPLKTAAAPGRWTFGDNPETTIIRLEDDVPITYSLSEDGQQLTLDFTCSSCNYPGGPTGRSGSVNGNWHMVFNKAE